jgi:heme A synthase
MSTLLLGMLLGLVLAALLALILVWAWESEWAQKMSEERELDPQSWLQAESRKAMELSLQRLQASPKEADK